MVTITGKSHIGRRSGNEDRFVADSHWGLAIVADGMGGPAAGEVAADVSTAVITDQLDLGASLTGAIVHANEEVIKAAGDGRGRKGMGTTVVAAHFHDHDFELAWIGDSRAYLWNGELHQLSRDHSKVESLLAKGDITMAEAATHPERNLISRALGLGEFSAADIPLVNASLFRDELLILCSDGLIDAVSGPDIATIIADATPARDNAALTALVDTLIERALANGGKDNITVVVVRADDDAPRRGDIALPPAVSIANHDGRHEYFTP